MQAIGYYLLYPVIYLCARSPFSVLYALSDFLYLIVYRVVGYRKHVVSENLRNAFPEKVDLEIRAMAKAYFRYFCDLVLETLKTIAWTEKQANERVKLVNKELMDRLYAENESVLLVMGHHGNWEWAGPCFSLTCQHQLVVVYNPLTHTYFDNMLSRARTKFSTQIISRKQVLREIIARKGVRTATALIADQSPNPVSKAHWMEFLHQDTPVNIGPAQIACKLGLPVVFMDVRRVGRGYYEIHPSLLAAQPGKADVLPITEAFNQKLEACIRRQPETWLWSHRRWKHKRAEQNAARISRKVNTI